ncbi:hypothetical protein CYY_003850 [Polysphondylium violaceum]|uniref:Sulfotransferase domain-containing protein n=1 Tax=Polysphondylium violaceum TaxID=133409 RepID=A0A8J4PYH0_9MYCE|nr:hypothetical protein CYY_003850 [Polysphondylium violaceum]
MASLTDKKQIVLVLVIVITCIIGYQFYVTRPQLIVENNNNNNHQQNNNNNHHQNNNHNNNNNENTLAPIKTNTELDANVQKLLELQKQLSVQIEFLNLKVSEQEKLLNVANQVMKRSLPKPTLPPLDQVGDKERDEAIQTRIQKTKQNIPNTCIPTTNGSLACMPNFIIIGTMKSGTTFLDFYLQMHPRLAKHKIKEVWFFNSHYYKGLEWYAKNFEQPTSFENQRVISEATPFYVNHPYTPTRMYAALKDVKLVLMLRDPVERCLSQYHFSLKWIERNKAPKLKPEHTFENLIYEEAEVIQTCVRGNSEYNSKYAQFNKDKEEGVIDMNREWNETNPFTKKHNDKGWNFYEQCSSCDKCFQTGSILHTSGHPTFGMLAKSLYYEQIEYWLNFYPLSQIHIIRYEDLTSRPEGVIRDVEQFLGLEEFNGYGDFVPKNVVSHDDMDPKIREFLVDYFREPNEKLYKLLGRDFGWAR